MTQRRSKRRKAADATALLKRLRKLPDGQHGVRGLLALRRLQLVGGPQRAKRRRAPPRADRAECPPTAPPPEPPKPPPPADQTHSACIIDIVSSSDEGVDSVPRSSGRGAALATSAESPGRTVKWKDGIEWAAVSPPSWLVGVGPAPLLCLRKGIRSRRVKRLLRTLRGSAGSRRWPADKPVATVARQHVLYVGDFQRLLGCRVDGVGGGEAQAWLSDAAVNGVLGLIQQRNDRLFANGSAPKWLPRVAVLTSFFWSKLGGSPSGFNYEAVKRWGRWTKDPPLLERDHILIPINHNNIHWWLVVLSPKVGAIDFYDSMPGGPGDKQRVAQLLLKWYRHEARMHGYSVIPRKRWRTALTVPGHSLQGDLSSCGVYTVMYAERLSMGIPAKEFGFSQADIPRLRKGLACCLINNDLPDYGLLEVKEDYSGG